MRNWILALAVGAGIGVVTTLAYSAAQQEQAEVKPKHTIAEVMQAAHAPGGSQLMRKVAAGDGSAEEKKQLLEFYVALWDNKPPKGEEEAWKAKTGALVVAASKALLGNEDSAAALRVAAQTKCGACHREHREA